MTLILSALSSDAVVLVADRRVVRLPTGTVVDEARNKVVLYQGAFAFFFSGLAEIGGMEADVWLARTLADGPVGPEAFERVAVRATAYVTGLQSYPPAWRRQAFCAVGWALDGDDLIPVWLTISNALDDRDQWLAKPRDRFDVRIRRMPSGRVWMLCPPVGATVHAGILSATRRDLRHALRRGTVPACMVLARGIRSAARSSMTIGTRLTGIVLPKQVCGREWQLSAPPLPLARDQAGPMAFDLDGPEGDFHWVLPSLAFERSVAFDSEVQGEAGAVRSVKVRLTKPPPGAKVGIGLRGSVSGKQVLFGLDENGKPFIETINGPGDKGPRSPGGTTS